MGSGKRLFGDGAETRALRFVDHKTLGSGVIVLTYQRAESE